MSPGTRRSVAHVGPRDAPLLLAALLGGAGPRTALRSHRSWSGALGHGAFGECSWIISALFLTRFPNSERLASLDPNADVS